MDGETVKFISDDNLRVKQDLAAVICKEFDVVMPKPLEEMSLYEVITTVPSMQEWLLYRLYMRIEGIKSKELLSSHSYFSKAVELGSRVLNELYRRLEDVAVHAIKSERFWRKLGIYKSYTVGEHIGFAIKSNRKMISLTFYIEEDGELPCGEILVIDEARNVFTISFVNSLSEVLEPNSGPFFY